VKKVHIGFLTKHRVIPVFVAEFTVKTFLVITKVSVLLSATF